MGTKAELVSRVREYCRSREDYEDIIGMGEGHTPRWEGRTDKSEYVLYFALEL
jgi:hypothetical protein